VGKQTHQTAKLLGGWKDLWVASHMDLLTCVPENRHHQSKT